MTILHEFGTVDVNTLAAVFGPHDQSVISGSWVEEAKLGPNISYSRNTGAYRIFCHNVHNARLDVVVEPGSDTTEAAAEEVWLFLRRALRTGRPSCVSVEVYDASGRLARTGLVGLRHQTWRRQVLMPAGVGVISAVLGIGLAVATNSPTPLVSAVPGIALGLLPIASGLTDWRTGRIRWVN